jgi:heterodisulfide reductase subunit A
MARIGVFTCWCGENIARTVDVEKAAGAVAAMPGVKCSLHYKYMCSDPGQAMVREKIAAEKLDRVVIAACSPHMHLKTFRRTVAAAGMNPYLIEMANIREHCSWVHHDKPRATGKAIELIWLSVEKARLARPLEPIRVPITRRALVIGGGVAGIQAALDIADAGYETVLVEREPSIGGKMAGLSETFPTLDCSQCILTPRMVEAGTHPNIRLHTYSEVEGVDGYVGNFEVTIRKKARYVDMDLCSGCGDCWRICPLKKNKSEFDFGMGFRPAIYVPFPQAVPARPVIDKSVCAKLIRNGCGLCEKKCAPGAINFKDEDRLIKERVGAVVVATGYKLYDIGKAQPDGRLAGYGEYGYGKYKDVIDGLQFERLASASGPTNGVLKRPSDGAEPRTVAFIACVGSRDNAKGMAYCSKICCMYTAKHAMLFKHKVHGGEAHVFYMDIRAGGKGYEEFVRRAIEQDGAKYHRGRVSQITQEKGKLIVRGADTLAGIQVTVEADMVVLATAMRPADGVVELARKLNAGCDENGFLLESHPKLRPVETNAAGVFIAGACHAPKDIPESVAQASAAAGKVAVMFASQELMRDPEVARIDASLCAACYACYGACAYHAIEKIEVKSPQGAVLKHAARVNPGLCMGCGTCVSICPSKCADIDGYSEQQIYSMVEALA